MSWPIVMVCWWRRCNLISLEEEDDGNDESFSKRMTRLIAQWQPCQGAEMLSNSQV